MRPQAEHRRFPEPLGEGRVHRAAMAGTPGRAAPARATTPQPTTHNPQPASKQASKQARRIQILNCAIRGTVRSPDFCRCLRIRFSASASSPARMASVIPRYSATMARRSVVVSEW